MKVQQKKIAEAVIIKNLTKMNSQLDVMKNQFEQTGQLPMSVWANSLGQQITHFEEHLRKNFSQ